MGPAGKKRIGHAACSGVDKHRLERRSGGAGNGSSLLYYFTVRIG